MPRKRPTLRKMDEKDEEIQQLSLRLQQRDSKYAVLEEDYADMKKAYDKMVEVAKYRKWQIAELKAHQATYQSALTAMEELHSKKPAEKSEKSVAGTGTPAVSPSQGLGVESRER